ncbi:uncharacterized protein Z518_09940 [Rhinocladiella mackenziei CBS 650.93]|uniref:Transcription factor domain-containing protein n=1 Tax=Rhinocladiella mackenziei CBS 650.93 TaxID=1442369 RepID=A0A0D2IW09_9EURO|nr:uncharacterized protein Z518_09940 [Rhinocladiella mackenziei CBS 650.93]KIX00875.1 hypothetical protein Z518_09940 [Rhinocladiella mackenziei CBS 650.93]
MENLEDRLRSLEDLIKSSVVANASQPQRQEQLDAMTPSSLPSSTSSTQPIRSMSDSLLTDTVSNGSTSAPNALMQSLGSDQLQNPVTNDPPSVTRKYPQVPPEISQLWISNGTTQFDMSVSAPNMIDVDLRPQVKLNGDKKCSLPPVHGGLFLLQEFLVDFNTAIPLFDAAAISTLFQDCYQGRADGTVISWVALKVVLGIAHRLRAMSPLGVGQDMENATIYLEESLSEVPTLLHLRSTPLLAQCLLGIAIIISTSSHPQPAALYVSMALRVVQDLHVNEPRRFNLVPPGDTLQLQRVFWIAYFMDSDMTYDPSDIAGEIAAANGEFQVNTFRLRVELALLQAEFMEQVLAPLTLGKPEYSDDMQLQALAAKLGDWRRNWLFELNVDNLHNHLHRSDLVHVIALESTYFSTAFAFHAHLSPTSKARRNPFAADGLTEGISKRKAQLLHGDARRFIDFMKLIPGDNIGYTRLNLETIISSLAVVLAHIIFDARDESAEPDFDVARFVLQVLHRLCNLSTDDGLVAAQNACVDLYLRAEREVQKRGHFRR